jgi:hypothetical protein
MAFLSLLSQVCGVDKKADDTCPLFKGNAVAKRMLNFPSKKICLRHLQKGSFNVYGDDRLKREPLRVRISQNRLITGSNCEFDSRFKRCRLNWNNHPLRRRDMKSRFFFGVFVGFIVAFLFFFFFFRGARAQTPPTSLQNRTAAYNVGGWNSYGGNLSEVQDSYTAANYYDPAEYDTYISYLGSQAKYGGEIAEYKDHAQYGDTVATYYEPTVHSADYARYSRKLAHYNYALYDVYQSDRHISVA